ncbi:Crp/Fnr family transcriptional regulator [Formosa haliotis]|uniref:Crp/Fnr family transcriptional regulator n=1 Tax=Formosa haliotis TaxID=1555194 RepID=UPI00082457D0|nr:Crp/Fnr family transcriptional regulator [Formosa haliotis]
MENLDFFLETAKENDLTEKVVKQLIDLSTIEHVKSKTVILDYGQKCDTVYFILNGAFITKAWDEEKQIEKTINFNIDSFLPYLTNPESYFSNAVSEKCIQAISDSTVMRFFKSDLEKIVDENKKYARHYNKMIIDGLIVENQIRTKLLTYSPKKFYSFLVSDYPEIIQNIPSKHIASFLGISDVWLSNLKKEH